MLVIPVLDIQNGNIVHAMQGNRNQYKPVTSLLTNKIDLVSVLSAYFKLYPFKTVYLADLDAIQEHGNNIDLIQNISNQYPDCEFWLDAGLIHSQRILQNPINNNIKIVFGSENKMKKEGFIGLVKNYPELILSLDFNSSGLIENQYLLDEPESWPKQVILMMLDKVGTNKGIDVENLKKIIEINKYSSLYVAGGIRNIDDIKQLDSIGIEGCLIASALHSGAITSTEIRSL